MRKAGAGGDKIAYEASKAAAGLQGGLRFKFSLPVFNLRYISPAIPFSNRVGFQIGRRFFSGMSGGQKLMHLVDQNVPGAAEAMQTFWNPVQGSRRLLGRQAPAPRDRSPPVQGRIPLRRSAVPPLGADGPADGALRPDGLAHARRRPRRADGD
jgi:hypothetical protein